MSTVGLFSPHLKQQTDSRSGLEYALRLAAAAALDVPVSAVLVDALRAPSQGQTEVSRMVVGCLLDLKGEDDNYLEATLHSGSRIKPK